MATLRQSDYKITPRGSKNTTGRADVLLVAHSMAYELWERGYKLGPKRSFFCEINCIVPFPVFRDRLEVLHKLNKCLELKI